MSTAPISPDPFFTPGARTVPVTDVPGTDDDRSGHRRPVLVAAVVAGAVAIAGVTAVAVVRTRSAAEPAAVPAARSVPDLSAMRPGGSVYDSQVPSAARSVPDLSAMRPGGSVYDSQVPQR